MALFWWCQWKYSFWLWIRVTRQFRIKKGNNRFINSNQEEIPIHQLGRSYVRLNPFPFILLLKRFNHRQLAGVVAIRTAGGPIIDLNYGRLDMPIELSRAIQSNNTISPSTNSLDIHANPANMKKKLTHRVSLRDYIPPVVLPCPCAPFTDGSPTADAHIRNIFYRLGFNNREIVAICGAHTLVCIKSLRSN